MCHSSSTGASDRSPDANHVASETLPCQTTLSGRSYDRVERQIGYGLLLGSSREIARVCSVAVTGVRTGACALRRLSLNPSWIVDAGDESAA